MTSEDLTQLVSSFFERLGFSAGDIAISSGHRTVVSIHSTDADALLNNKGEGLRALNALARRMAEKQYGEEAANFLVDVNDYHERQMEAVRSSARMLAQRTRLFKHDVEMEPMSSYERLVIHELFADDPEIETRSEGEGKFRHIVLSPRGSHAGAKEKSL